LRFARTTIAARATPRSTRSERESVSTFATMAVGGVIFATGSSILSNAWMRRDASTDAGELELLPMKENVERRSGDDDAAAVNRRTMRRRRGFASK